MKKIFIYFFVSTLCNISIYSMHLFSLRNLKNNYIIKNKRCKRIFKRNCTHSYSKSHILQLMIDDALGRYPHQHSIDNYKQGKFDFYCYKNISIKEALIYLYATKLLKEKYKNNHELSQLKDDEIILKPDIKKEELRKLYGWQPFLYGTNESSLTLASTKKEDNDEIKKDLAEDNAYFILGCMVKSLDIWPLDIQYLYDHLNEILWEHTRDKNKWEIIICIQQPIIKNVYESMQKTKNIYTIHGSNQYVYENIQFRQSGSWEDRQQKTPDNQYWHYLFSENLVPTEHYGMVKPFDFFKTHDIVVRIPKNKFKTGTIYLQDMHGTLDLYKNTVEKEFDDVIKRYTSRKKTR